MHAAVVALSVAMLPMPVRAVAPSSAKAAQAKSALSRGQEAYERGDFAAAMEAFEQAYELDPQPVYLYPWAQAARNAGDCDLSRELYQRFVDSGVRGDARVAAEQNMRRCEPAADPVPEPPAPASPAVAPQPDPPPPRPPPDEPERRKADPLGVALLSTGSVATVAGIAVLGVSAGRIAEQGDATDHARFDDLDRSIDRLQIAGSITLGVGAALLIGGAIRLGVVRRARSRPVAVTATRTRRGTPVLGFRVEFGG